MTEPLAYFLTWPTYGSWLHGDARGSVDRRTNIPATPMVEPNPRRMRWEREQLKSAIVELDPASRRIVADTIEDHCRHRNWELLALAVRSNHVHVVVGYPGIYPERIVAEFKAWATRRLREAGHVAHDARVWVRHGSTRYLWNDQSVNAAVAYVVDGQDIPK